MDGLIIRFRICFKYLKYLMKNYWHLFITVLNYILSLKNDKYFFAPWKLNKTTSMSNRC